MATEGTFIRDGNVYVADSAARAGMAIGGLQEVPLIYGLQAFIQDLRAASQEIKTAAGEMRLSVDRTDLMYRSRASAEDLLGVTQGGISRSYLEAINQAHQQTITNTVDRIPDRLPPPGGAVTNTADDVIPLGQMPNSWDTFTRTRDYFGGRKGFSISNLRQDLGRRTMENIGDDWRWRGGSIPALTMDGSGTWRTEDGSLANPAQIGRFLRNERVTGALRTAAGTLAEGGTLRQAGVAAMPGGLARAAGAAGAIFYAGSQVADFAERQRAENAEFQSVLGGGQMDAFAERGRQRLFSLGQVGLMGRQQAEDLYMGVTEMGLTGQDRSTALDFATQNYREFGMSVKQSLDLVAVAARTGQESLSGLTVALRDVTRTAAEAGVNTERARQAFIDNFSTFATIFGGEAAIAGSQGLSAATVGLGRQFEGVSTSGMGSSDALLMAASRGGMTRNQLLAADPGQMFTTSSGQQVSGDMLSMALTQEGLVQGFTALVQPDGMALLQREAAQGPMSDEKVREVANTLMNNGWVADVASVIQVAELYGVRNLNFQNAVPFLVNTLTGQWNPTAEAQQIKAEQATRQISGSAIDAERERVREQGVRRGGLFGMDRNDQDVFLTDYYMRDVEATGRAGGISGRIASDPSVRAGMEYVQVQTADGPRVVPLEQAMLYYRDQIDSGTAVVAGTGMSISEAVNMRGDESVSVTSTTQSAESWMKTPEQWSLQQGDKGSGGGTVVLGLTDEARRFFVPQTMQGNVAFDEEWSPNEIHVSPTGRPTGNY